MLDSGKGWRWLAAGLVAASAAVHLPGLFIGPSLDAAVFDVVGWRVAEGAPLYAGIWDHKPPGIYLLTLLAEAGRAVLDPWFVTWSLSVVATAATGVLLVPLLRRAGLGHVAPVVALLVVLTSGQYLISLGGGLAEQPATVAALGALLLASWSAGPLRWTAAGALLAVGVIVSVQAAPAGLALLAVGIGARTPLRSVAAAVGGGTAVVLATVAMLAALGVLGPALDAVFAYNAAYRLAAAGSVVSLSTLPWTVLASIPLVTLAAAGLLALRRWPDARPTVVAASAWVAGSLVLLVVQGRFYAHYVVPLVAPMGLLAAVALADLDRVRARNRRLTPMLAVAGVALLLVAAGAGLAGGLQEAGIWSPANQQARTVAGTLRSLSSPSQTILVWGNQPYLYRLSERAPALRYPYLSPLTTPGYGSEQLVNEMVASVSEDAPTLIIDAGSSAVGQAGGPPLLMDRPTATEGRELDLLDPLRDFVRANYELYGIVDGWPVYRMKR